MVEFNPPTSNTLTQLRHRLLPIAAPPRLPPSLTRSTPLPTTPKRKSYTQNDQQKLHSLKQRQRRAAPLGRRDLVRFFVQSAIHFGHTESEVSSGSDNESSSGHIRHHIEQMMTDHASKTNQNKEHFTKELEKILSLTLERLQTRAYNKHSIAGALHNLGCFYAANGANSANEDDYNKAIALTARALTMRRKILTHTSVRSTTSTPRNPERDRLAIAESLNDQGVLLLVCPRNNNTNVDVDKYDRETIRWRLRGEKMLTEASVIFQDIHSFLHPLNITSLQTLAFAKKLNGERTQAVVLLQDALARATVSNNNPLIIGLSLDFADVCFRHKHMTQEVIGVLTKAFELASSHGSGGGGGGGGGRDSANNFIPSFVPNEYPFDTHTILTLGHQLALLYFSRRRYLHVKRWLHTCIAMYQRSIRDNHRTHHSSRALLALKNDINQLNTLNNDRLERIRLDQERKARLLKEKEHRLLVAEQIRLGILNPDGSDPVEIERLKQAALADKKRKKEQRRQAQQRKKDEKAAAEARLLEELRRGKHRQRPHSAGKKNTRHPSSVLSTASVTSVSSSVKLEGKRPRTSPLSSLSTRPTTAYPARRRRTRGGGVEPARARSALNESTWFQSKQHSKQGWVRQIDQQERRGARAAKNGGSVASLGGRVSSSTAVGATTAGTTAGVGGRARRTKYWSPPATEQHKMFVSPLRDGTLTPVRRFGEVAQRKAQRKAQRRRRPRTAGAYGGGGGGSRSEDRRRNQFNLRREKNRIKHRERLRSAHPEGRRGIVDGGEDGGVRGVRQPYDNVNMKRGRKLDTTAVRSLLFIPTCIPTMESVPTMESIVLSEASSLVANHILVDAEEEEEREAEGGPEEEDM